MINRKYAVDFFSSLLFVRKSKISQNYSRNYLAIHFVTKCLIKVVKIYMLSSKYGFGQSMDCLHKVWILTLSGQSMDCLLNPRIEHAQCMDWGNPWIAPISKD